MVLMNELIVQKGRITINGKLSYSPQLPWIFPGTIRQNIIFGKPFQKELYKKVITACALSRVSTISIIFFIRTNFINTLRFYSPKLNTAYNIVRKKSNYLFNVSGFFYSLTDCWNCHIRWQKKSKKKCFWFLCLCWTFLWNFKPYSYS